MSVRCNDDSASLSNGDAQRSPSPQTQVRAQQHPMELDLAPSLSRSRSTSVSSQPDTSYHDVNRKLTCPSSPRDRPQRPPTLPPPTNQNRTPHSVFAISGSYNNNYYSSQNVLPSVVNASPALYSNSHQPTGQNVFNRRTLESSNFHSSVPQHVPINDSHNRPRTSTQVFHRTSDLAAHYGIPTFLPPAPSTIPRRAQTTDSHPQPPSQPEFADICSNYLNMLAQKPGDNNMTEDPVMVSAHDSTAPVFPPAVTQEAAVQALMDVFQGDSHCPCTACAATLTPLSLIIASPELQTMADFSEYLTSPFDDSPIDDDLLTTPAIGSGDLSGVNIFTSPIMDDWTVGGYIDDDQPVFNPNFGTLFPVEKQPADTPPMTVSPSTIDLNGMWTLSPQTPSLDHSTFNSPSVQSNNPLPSTRRKSTATGTRKNVTPETLVPIDAPTQPRKYTTPSATSRKEVPAVFARKRARSQAFGDEEDQLEDEAYTLPPNATEQELIEAKRRQNTIAARRSRKRKLEYQRELEDSLENVKLERDMWKSRALTYHALIKSHGLESPEFHDS
jgi:Basic region leucine zipper